MGLKVSLYGVRLLHDECSGKIAMHVLSIFLWFADRGIGYEWFETEKK